MVESIGKRFTAEGLENLRVLMDSLLPRLSGRGRPVAVLSTGQPDSLPRLPWYQSGTGAGETGKLEAAGSPAHAGAGMEIHCLNPQTLGSGCREQGVARRKVDWYYHRGSRFSRPLLEIVRLPKIRRGDSPGTRRSVVLQVEVRRREGGPDLILPLDEPVLREGPWLPPGKGSRPGEAEA